MQPGFLGKVLPTLCASTETKRGCGPHAPGGATSEKACPKVLPVRTEEGGLSSGGYSQQGGPGGGTVAALVGDQGLGWEEGAVAGEADEEGPLQLLGRACWVLPFHVMLLELGVGEELRQRGHCRAPRWPEGLGRGQGSPARVSRTCPMPQNHDNSQCLCARAGQQCRQIITGPVLWTIRLRLTEVRDLPTVKKLGNEMESGLEPRESLLPRELCD